MKRLLLAIALSSLSAFASAGDKPVVAVAEFKNESGAGWWSGGMGWDLAGMLSNELVSTGSFNVVERSKLENVLEEQNLMASGRAKLSDAAKMGKLAGAQYLVMGTVTDYEENTKDSGGGLSFAGVSIGGKSKSAYLAIDIRVVNTSTGQIEFVRTIEGTSKGGGMHVGYSGAVSGNAGGENNTPAGKAIRGAVVMVSDYLDCVMVRKDGCVAKFDALEQHRRDKTKDSLKLD